MGSSPYAGRLETVLEVIDGDAQLALVVVEILALFVCGLLVGVPLGRAPANGASAVAHEDLDGPEQREHALVTTGSPHGVLSFCFSGRLESVLDGSAKFTHALYGVVSVHMGFHGAVFQIEKPSLSKFWMGKKSGDGGDLKNRHSTHFSGSRTMGSGIPICHSAST